MLMATWGKAENLHRALKLTPPLAATDLESVAAHLLVEVESAPLLDPVRQLILEGTVIQQAGLPVSESRWLLAHALGHMIFHADDQRNFVCFQHSATDLEQRADLFAGCLLIGNPFSLRHDWSARELAEWAQVPCVRVVDWLSLLWLEEQRPSPLPIPQLRLRVVR